MDIFADCIGENFSWDIIRGQYEARSAQAVQATAKAVEFRMVDLSEVGFKYFWLPKSQMVVESVQAVEFGDLYNLVVVRIPHWIRW